MTNEHYPTDGRWIPHGSLGNHDQTEFFLFELDQPLHQYRHATVFNVVTHNPETVKYTSFWVLWNGKDFEKNTDEDRLRELPDLWQAAHSRLDEITVNNLLFG